MSRLLVKEQPYAHVVRASLAHLFCAHCLQRSSWLVRCPLCKLAYYCGTNCENNDWIFHKDECEYLTNARENGFLPDSIFRILFRVLLKQYGKDGMKKPGSEGSSFNGRTFESLKTRPRSSRFSEQIGKLYMRFLQTLSNFTTNLKMPDMHALLNMFDRVLMNITVIYSDDLTGIGTGLYIGLSELDHSCVPDSYILYEGSVAALRTRKRGVKEYKNSLRIAYCDPMLLTADRQEQLNMYCISCNCARCNDEQRDFEACSLACNSCHSGFCPVDKTRKASFPCVQCRTLPSLNLEKAIKLMDDIADLCRNNPDTPQFAEKGRALFAVALNQLSAVNIYRYFLATRLSMVTKLNGDCEKAAVFMEETVQFLERFSVPGSPSLSVKYYIAGRLHAANRNWGLAIERLEKAAVYLRKTHGGDHPLSTDVRKRLETINSIVAAGK